MPQVIEISFEELATKHSELEARYATLKKLCADMLESREAYRKGGKKDARLLKKSYALEAVIKGIVSPKPVRTEKKAIEEFLGQ